MKNKQNLIEQHSQQLSIWLEKYNYQLVCAESCTAGGLMYAITSIPGSSNWFDGGFVTYSNAAKINCLQVSQNSLKKFGAVSTQVACEMAQGALCYSRGNIAISITGIAGPGGASDTKPVGTVCFALTTFTQKKYCCQQHFKGDRTAIREAAIEFALQYIVECIQKCHGIIPQK